MFSPTNVGKPNSVVVAESGSKAERSFDVTARPMRVLAATCGVITEMSPNAASTWPLRRSGKPAPVLR